MVTSNARRRCFRLLGARHRRRAVFRVAYCFVVPQLLPVIDVAGATAVPCYRRGWCYAVAGVSGVAGATAVPVLPVL